MNCIETGLAMCESHEMLTEKLLDEFLPSINFRISFDYGQVMTVKTGDWVLDLIGSTINICSKINHKCIKNEMVIGDDLYKQVKNVKEYKFNKNGECELNLKHSYQIHSVKRKSPKLKILN
jgi:adenylate cyclase